MSQSGLELVEFLPQFGKDLIFFSDQSLGLVDGFRRLIQGLRPIRRALVFAPQIIPTRSRPLEFTVFPRRTGVGKRLRDDFSDRRGELVIPRTGGHDGSAKVAEPAEQFLIVGDQFHGIAAAGTLLYEKRLPAAGSDLSQ